jgi:hypothetical protein
MAVVASANDSVVQAARQALTEWKQTKLNEAAVQDQHKELAHRILALKRVRRSKVADGRLQRLLRQSVSASADLERLAQLQAQRSEVCAQSIHVGIKSIDKEISLHKKGLKSPSKVQRKKTAKRLRRLLQQRTQLRKMQAELLKTKTTPKSWKQYEVKIGPLDGPKELREKADFIEDTRDKLNKKRRKIFVLIKERKQMLALAKVANQFATDVSAFDESARSGRVERQGQRSGASFSGSFGQADEAQSVPIAPPQTSERTNTHDTQAAGSNQGNQSPSRGTVASDTTESFGPGGTSEGDNTSDANPSAPNTANDAIGTSIGSADQSASTWVQQLDPDMLINLKISDLFSDDVNFEQLDSLMKNIEKLDLYLKSQSSNIMRRADRIEEDERQVLQP